MAKRAGAKPRRKITKVRFMKALEGSGGVKTIIARRMGVTWNAIQRRLKRKDWASARKALYMEENRILDIAEQTLEEAMTQKKDPKLAVNTAKWVLSRRRRDIYAEKPPEENTPGTIRIQAEQINLAQLNLPLDVRRKLLEAMRAEREVDGGDIIESREIEHHLKKLPGPEGEEGNGDN